MAQRYKILIVDDEVALITLLKEELQDVGGYEVDLAFDGVEAINLIQKSLYDVVLLDMKMPRVDGREVLKFIQENSPTTHVIILSQYADIKMAVETTKLGAYEVLGKPYDIDQVEQTIERAIERKKLSIDNKLLQTELS
jgi:two-component system response regulator PilR (NtrC family)